MSKVSLEHIGRVLNHFSRTLDLHTIEETYIITARLVYGKTITETASENFTTVEKVKELETLFLQELSKAVNE